MSNGEDTTMPTETTLNEPLRSGPLFGRSGRYWSPPFRLQEDMLIVDKKGAPILFVSGWAHLVGLGSHHLAVRDAHAAQVDLGAEIVGFLNRNWPNTKISHAPLTHEKQN